MKKYLLIATTSSLSLLAGLIIASKNVAQSLTIAGIVGAPIGIATYLIFDSKLASERNKNNRLVKEVERKYEQQFKEFQRKSTANQSTLIDKNKSLITDIESYKHTTATLRTQLTDCKSAKDNLEMQLGVSLEVISDRDSQINNLTVNIEHLESELKEAIRHYEEDLDKELAEYKEAELTKVEDEHFAFVERCLSLVSTYRSISEQIGERLEVNRNFCLNAVDAHNAKADEMYVGYLKAKKAWDEEKAALGELIERLNEQIAQLQRENRGELIDPVRIDCGFDQNGRIANAVIDWMWSNHQLPLKVCGYAEEAGVVSIGLSYGTAETPERVTGLFDKSKEVLARNLGLYVLLDAKKSPLADLVIVRIQRERPARKTRSENLYRTSEEFIKYMLSQPYRYRIIGEPGSGKTPTVVVLLSHLINAGFPNGNTPNGRKLPHTVIEYGNPLAGISVKNGNELDFCFKWSEPLKAFKGLRGEYLFRKESRHQTYKDSVGYIWVLDEFDNAVGKLHKDDVEPFKDVLKDGGHINMGVIVMGQSANISTTKGLSIDDQKMLTNVYIDPVSIRTFLTQYGERFYSKRTVERALNTLEEIETTIETENEVICDSAREVRIALVVADKSPVFYQLPYFDSVKFDKLVYVDTLRQVAAIRVPDPAVIAVTTSQNQGFQTAATAMPNPYVGGTATRQEVACPHCGSTKVRSNGHLWRCADSEHDINAPDKPKSWKKGV